ncbi:hypothetical protein Ptr86124_000258 [Pyrenophora tritici-repentis]|uniref:Uncharacterized protein n=1 Tax=Pyrenophora tritici-repentis TaxID=45151 RepID=A0A922NPY3_9PLEO|nr:hypothetical protein Ptr86124_000258 [Pyrenophora tritici-repentis]
MASLFRTGQVLRGRLGTYTITKQLRSTVWFAKDQAQKPVVIKGVQNHVRVENERDVLQRFQHRTPYIRGMIDELEHPSDPVTIALQYTEKRLETCISP